MSEIACDDKQVLDVLERLAGERETGQRLDPPPFHPFPARMPVSLAKYLIQHLTTTSAIVLDPLAGSGMTLVAARQLGRHSVGLDRDPLAVLLARSASQSFDSTKLDEQNLRVLERAEKIHRSRQFCLPLLRLQFPEEDQEFIRYWFPPRSQKQLFALANSILEEPEGLERGLAWVVFSSLIIAKSAGASSARDVARSRPHKSDDKPVVLPFDAWNRRFKSAITKLPFIDNDPPEKSLVQRSDARALPLGSNTVDLVLTSPPYLNAIDYLRGHKFSLLWMGHELMKLRELRGTLVGTERGLWSRDGLPQVLERRLKRGVEENRRRAMLRRYLSDLQRILKEMDRVVRPGGLALIVMGPTIISARRTDAESVIANIVSSTRLRVIGAVARRLSPSRRSLPPPSTSGQEFLSQRMRREVIVALRKVDHA